MKNLIVIDNFYSQPDTVRNLALSAEYLTLENLGTGRKSVETKRCYYSQSVVEKIEQALGFKIKVDPRKASFGAFAKSLPQNAATSEGVIHTDATEWVGVLYLNPEGPCSSGTTLFEHKSTGLCEKPHDVALAAQLEVDGKNRDLWKASVKVGFKYNRLVLFKAGSLYHATESFFGNTNEEARLTQLFFFNEEPVCKE